MTNAEVEVVEVVSDVEALDCFGLSMVCGRVCLIQNKALPDPPGDKDRDVVIIQWAASRVIPNVNREGKEKEANG